MKKEYAQLRANYGRSSLKGWIPVQLALVLAATADARDDGKRSATARAAVVSAIPDGNHGDNNLPTVPGDRS